MTGGILGGLTLGELAKKTWKEIGSDRCLNRSAELAFFFLLALFPALIFLISLLGFIPGTPQLVIDYLDSIVPKQAMGLVRNWVDQVFSGGHGGILSFSFLFSIWTASTGVSELIEMLNIAYEVREGRSFWKKRLVAIALTLALVLLVIGGATIVVYGRGMIDWAFTTIGAREAAPLAAIILSYAVGLGMLLLGIGLLYHFGPNVDHRWKWVTPGALFSVATLLLASWLFSLYLRYGPGLSATYGYLGAVIALMLWLYMVSLVIMVGAEINDAIARGKGEEPKERKEAPEGSSARRPADEEGTDETNNRSRDDADSSTRRQPQHSEI